MKQFKLVTDSCSNIGASVGDPLDIAIASTHFMYNDEDHIADNDWKEMSAKAFYDLVRNGTKIHTSQADMGQYEKIFRDAAKDGKDALLVSVSKVFSSSIDEARRARLEVLKDYPDMRIEIVDSCCACYAEGMLVLECAKLRDAGKSLDEVLAYIEENKLAFNEVGTVGSLTYLRKAGRVNAASAFFANLIGIKPIIVSDVTGQNIAIEKVKGRNKSLVRIAEYIREYNRFDEIPDLYINHADCLEDGEQLEKIIRDMIPDKKINVHYNFIESAIGNSVGPGTLIINFFARKEMRKSK